MHNIEYIWIFWQRKFHKLYSMCLDKKYLEKFRKIFLKLLRIRGKSSLHWWIWFRLGNKSRTRWKVSCYHRKKRINHSLENYCELPLKLTYNPQNHFCSSFHVANRLMTEAKIRDSTVNSIITSGQAIVPINSYIHTHLKHIYYWKRVLY